MSGFTMPKLDAILDDTPGSPVAAIETGTFKGDTTALLAQRFADVRTIEASVPLWSKALDRFADVEHVTCYHGDSAELFGDVLRQVGDCLVYLDAHAWEVPAPGSEEAVRLGFPLFAELEACRASANCKVVVVDDVHAFGRFPSWVGVSVESIVAALKDRVTAYQVRGDQCVVWLS